MSISSRSIPSNRDRGIEYSGVAWLSRFRGSTSISELRFPFRSRVEAFVGALRNAGAIVVINGTLRDPRRAFLMHWCWRIAKQNFDPQRVPSMEGVDICWAHVDRAGKYSRGESINAARRMVLAFGMNNLGVAPALTSRHIAGCAIDMSISWRGVLTIADAYGQMVQIKTAPWSGLNVQLRRVGLSYGVIKYNRNGRDDPHWSDTGA